MRIPTETGAFVGGPHSESLGFQPHNARRFDGRLLSRRDSAIVARHEVVSAEIVGSVPFVPAERFTLIGICQLSWVVCEVGQFEALQRAISVRGPSYDGLSLIR